jgi:hypothetical protein
MPAETVTHIIWRSREALVEGGDEAAGDLYHAHDHPFEQGFLDAS